MSAFYYKFIRVDMYNIVENRKKVIMDFVESPMYVPMKEKELATFFGIEKAKRYELKHEAKVRLEFKQERDILYDEGVIKGIELKRDCPLCINHAKSRNNPSSGFCTWNEADLLSAGLSTSWNTSWHMVFHHLDNECSARCHS